MTERIPDFLKAAKATQAAAKAVEAASKVLAKEASGPAAIAEAADGAVTALKKVVPTDTLASAVREELASKSAVARAALERERALLAGAVAAELAKVGLKAEGHLPMLRAGVLTLEFNFGPKGRCVAWFGPRHERLADCPLEAVAIAAKAAELDKALLGGEFNEAAFLADLHAAYRTCAVRQGVAEGDRVPLTALLAEVAFRRQRPAFLADPKRETFMPYGRVEFACALSRLKTRRHGDRELRLDVATMAQTRRPEDHVWVPRGRSGDGTQYATASFVKAAV